MTNSAFGVSTINLATGVTGTLGVPNGGTGQSTWTNGQLAIGNTTGNTLTKATLTGTANQVTVTNGTGTIILGLPQDIGIASTPTFGAFAMQSGGDIRGPGTGAAGIAAWTGATYQRVASWTNATNPRFEIVGITDGVAVNTGKVGESISSNIAIGSAVSLVTATSKTVTSISLTAGVWYIWGNVGFSAGATSTITLLAAGISATTNNFDTVPAGGSVQQIQATFTTGGVNLLSAGAKMVNVSATTSYFLIAQGSFAVSTLAAYGYISAIRVA